jgi:hypothetical protein
MTIDAIAPGGKVLCDVDVSEECSVSELIRDLIMHFNLTMGFQYTLERVGEREKLGPDQTLLEAGVISVTEYNSSRLLLMSTMCSQRREESDNGLHRGRDRALDRYVHFEHASS